MKVFLTGATGFVGSHVARRLVQRGHDVHALVLGDVADDRRFESRLGAEGRSVTKWRGDLLARASWTSALEEVRPEACIHLGWYANPSDYLVSRVNLDLLSATTALASTLIDLGTRRLVAVGTCFEYDTSAGWLGEASPLAPRHLYSACKRAAGELLAQLTRGTATSFAWARLFYLYGPHEHGGRLVPAVIDALRAGKEARVSTGEQIRDFLHVADAAAALVHVLETDALVGPVNVASGAPVSVRRVVETIAELMGQRERIAWGAIQPRPDDPAFVCANVAKLSATGFSPVYDLESGLRDTIARANEEPR